MRWRKAMRTRFFILVMKHWYVLSTAFRKELTVRDSLRQQGIHCYVPLRYLVEQQHGHKVRRLVPAISAMVFVYDTVDAISAAKHSFRHPVYWLTRPVIGQETREKVIVPDKAMEDFIRVTQQSEAEVTYFRPDEVALSKGEHIRIHGGLFDGVEGVLLKLKGKRSRQLVVTIPDLAVAAVTITPDVVEVKSRLTSQSSHLPSVDVTAKRLIVLAEQLLTAPPDKETQKHEYNLMHREVSVMYAVLKSRKGYLPSAEAELSLSLLLAERVLNIVSDATLQRCREAVFHLKSTSKLRGRLYRELKNQDF